MRLSLPSKVAILASVAILSTLGVALSTASSESGFSILLVALLPILSITFADYDPIDPRVWFPIFGGLYSFSFFVLHLFGVLVANDFGSGVFLGHIFLTSTIIAMWILSTLRPKRPLSFTLSESAIAFPRLFIRLCVLLSFGLWLYVAADATLLSQVSAGGKRALKELGVGLPGVNTALTWATFFYVILLWTFWTDARRRSLLIALVGLFVLYYWMGTGERDAILRWFMITAFLALYHKSVSLKFIYSAGALTLVLLPVMKDLGVLLVSDDVDFQRSKDLLVWIFRLEWRGAGENFDTLLVQENLYSGKGLELFMSDVVRGFLPGSLFSGSNTSGWYYQEYTPVVIGRTVNGLGFSYAGGWYIYANTLGVILGGCFFGVVCWCFFIASRKNLLVNSAYVIFVPMAIWSLRGDLSSFLSILTKQSLLPTLFAALVLISLKALAGQGSNRVGTRLQNQRLQAS